MKGWLVPVGVVLALAGAWAYRHHQDAKASTSPAAVAALAGATYCDDSGYYVKSRLDGSKETIYDCQIGARMQCVTVSGGIATNSTATVRLLFTNTLGASKPACI